MKKVLIIDSDKKVSRDYGKQLGEEGYKVVYAQNGKDAQAKIKKLNPDSILLELKLQGADGMSLLKTIKKDPKTRDIPILILTKEHDPDELTEAAKLGVTLYFVKDDTSFYILNKWIQSLTSHEKVKKEPAKPKRYAKILLVEDDQLMIDLYQKTLSYEGFDLESAQDGVEGLKKARAGKPALILLDLMMPYMNGIEMLKELKKDAGTKAIPVVVLTNLVGTKHADEAMALGAVKYIVKSEQEPKEIVSMVKEILGEEEKREVPVYK